MIRLVLYTDDAEAAVPARFAGIDAVVDRSAEPRELIEAVRGERTLPEVHVGAQRRAAARLEPDDRAILAMRLAGTAPHDIAATVGITRVQLARRFARIVALLRNAAPRSFVPT